MRKKLAVMLLLGALLTVTACAAGNVEEPGAVADPDRFLVEDMVSPENTPEPKETAKADVASAPGSGLESKVVWKATPSPRPAELDYTVEERIAAIKMPQEWYAFSCDRDKVIFYSRGEEYGWLAPYEFTPVKGASEVDSIIHDLSGANGITELIDTREEGNAVRYVFAIHRSRYAMGEVEFLAQAGIISEEEAMAQERTELFIAYKVNGEQWWGFSVKSDIFGGEGLLDALKFEITFVEIN